MRKAPITSPLGDSRKRTLPTYNMKAEKNLRLNDFKKSYLNLDSKLSKCTIQRDYFKESTEQLKKNNNRYESSASSAVHNPSHHISSSSNLINRPIYTTNSPYQANN
jgi:hypothetical protein